MKLANRANNLYNGFYEMIITVMNSNNIHTFMESHVLK